MDPTGINNDEPNEDQNAELNAMYFARQALLDRGDGDELATMLMQKTAVVQLVIPDDPTNPIVGIIIRTLDDNRTHHVATTTRDKLTYRPTAAEKAEGFIRLGNDALRSHPDAKRLEARVANGEARVASKTVGTMTTLVVVSEDEPPVGLGDYHALDLVRPDLFRSSR